MLPATQDLIRYLSRGSSSRDSTLITTYVHVIGQCGTKADADYLLPVFLAEPFHFYHSLLFPVFQKFGDLQTAEALFKACMVSGRLHEDAFPEVLEVLGDLNYAPVKEILIHYALNPESDHYTGKYAVAGLLNFDCRDIQQQIVAGIEACYGKHLFSEFIPALVCKLTDRVPVLAKLYELGNDGIPSVDCMGGIIQAFSLCGKEGEPYFRKMLFNPYWGALDSGTGNAWHTYCGMQRLAIGFKDLYAEVKGLVDPAQKWYAVEALLALLEIKVTERSAVKSSGESYLQIYEALYSWKHENERDNLLDLARAFEKEDQALHIETLLKLKMHEQLLKEALTTG